MNREFYDSYVKDYKDDDYFKTDFPLSNEQRVRDFQPFLRSPVLDVGCNRGHDSNFFANRGFSVEGCDIPLKP